MALPLKPGSPRTERRVNFDRLARAYRWLEWLSFGTALQRCRTRLLPHLAPCRSALVLGDGDGRGLQALVRAQPHLNVTAVDLSPAMLAHLRRRCEPFVRKLTTVPADARDLGRALPAGARFDLVTTHFVLDCFEQSGVEAVALAVTAHTRPNAQWLVSEFRVPTGWRRTPARLMVRGLYLAFGALTGLRVRALPDHRGALARAGWTCLHEQHSLRGLLTAELWQRLPPTGPAL